jgi:methylmalonyl-CoA mutase C-terminal domain/subunit
MSFDERPIRVVVSKVGLDGHERGARVIAAGFRDAGMEVIYTGLRRTPDELAEIVLQEDADVIGLSILSGAVKPLTRRVVDALHGRGLDDVVVLVGGIISPKLAEELRAIGVDAAFGPGSTLNEIVAVTRERVRAKRGSGDGAIVRP